MNLSAFDKVLNQESFIYMKYITNMLYVSSFKSTPLLNLILLMQ